MAQKMSFSFTILLLSLSSSAMAAYNIVDFGARPDGRTDSAKAFLSAWAKACGSNKPATVYVPAGRFFLSQATFQGPCNNAGLRILIDGTIVAPSGYGSMLKWIFFKNLDGVSIHGGTLDGRGQPLWACKLAGRSCPVGATVGSVWAANLALTWSPFGIITRNIQVKGRVHTSLSSSTWPLVFKNLNYRNKSFNFNLKF